MLCESDSRTARKVRPLFEIGRLTDAIRERKAVEKAVRNYDVLESRFLCSWEGMVSAIGYG